MNSYAPSVDELGQINSGYHRQPNIPMSLQQRGGQTQGSPELLTNDSLIPLGSRIVHKFYEPVILLASLTDVVKSRSGQPSSTEELLGSQDDGDSDKDYQTFKTFVNKLAHVCSCSKGRETVTSFMVLRDEPEPKSSHGRIHYWFAANEQTKDDLMNTKVHVQSLLLKVGQTPTGSEDQERLDIVRMDMYRDVLVFNHSRISSYLREMQDHALKCLERCDVDETDECRLLSKHIKPIVDPENIGASTKAPETDYISKVQTTIRLLLLFEKSDVYYALLRRAKEGRLMVGSSQECFSDFVHTYKRILAYPLSVQYILTVAKNKWPELFDQPLVSFYFSSKPIPRPQRAKSLSGAESIVGRMTRKVKEMEIFRDFVNRLQVFDLDDRIRNEYSKESFTPVVHSEILLLNKAWNTHGGATEGRINPSVFFNEWMFIGSSKPSCRLCDYYFEERRSAVQHRHDGHGNLYPAWAFPEVFSSQGEAAIADRQIMVDRVLQRVRKDAFEVVRKKVAPQHKQEDSNTFTEAVTLEDKWTIQSSVSNVDDITSMLGEMDIEDYDEENGGAPLGDE